MQTIKPIERTISLLEDGIVQAQWLGVDDELPALQEHLAEAVRRKEEETMVDPENLPDEPEQGEDDGEEETQARPQVPPAPPPKP